jgi:hypothetical protein
MTAPVQAAVQPDNLPRSATLNQPGGTMPDPKTIVFFPEGAFGPTNNCVGIGDVLRKRGHRVVFIVEESFAGTLEAKGFEEQLMRLGPKPEVEEAPGQFWIDFIRDTAPVFRKPTIEQLCEFIAPTWQALIDGAKFVQPRLVEIFDELGPDVIVEDNVVGFAAVVTARAPWVRITSCNPAEIKDPAIPPFSSGLPTADRTDWPAFLEEVDRTHRDMWSDFDTFMRDLGAPGLTRSAEGPDFIHESAYRTSTSIQKEPTTGASDHWRKPGIDSNRPCAQPTRSGICPTTCARATGRSFTCRSVASARPTSP